MIFNNVNILGYNHQNNFFGEKSFVYSTKKTLSIKGYILDLLNYNGVKDIFDGAEQIKQMAQNFQNVVINNENYGTGKIVSLSFDSGNWVRTTEFSADIEILEDVPLTNLGPEFTNTNLNDKNLGLLNSFKESFSLDFNTQNKVLGGEHSIEIEYNANNINTNVLVLAQRLAQELLKTLPNNLSEGNYSVRPPNTYKTTKSETYDLVNGNCGFSKNFSYKSTNVDKPFSVSRSISIKLDNQGEASVEESCTITAENDIPSLYECALIGLNHPSEGINNSFARCSSVFDRYKQANRFNISTPLNANPVTKNININKFNGTIEYNIVFDNDRKKANNTYTFEKTLILDRGEDWIWTVSEKGTIEGIGPKYNLINNIKYTNAQNAWNIIKNLISSGTSNFWGTNVPSNDKASNLLKLISRNISRQPAEGKIDYTYSYSDDPRINPNSDIRKVEIKISDDGGNGSNLKPIYKEFLIANRTRSLVQNLNLKQQGTYTVTVNAEITLPNQNDVFNGYSYFSRVRQLAPVGGGSYQKYLESIDYSTDEIEQTVSYSATYKYSS
jgi:hypothetical protein